MLDCLLITNQPDTPPFFKSLNTRFSYNSDEDFHNLIDERYENAATIITSNLDFGEWGDAFPNKLLGAATLDRLRHGAYRLVLDGESYRTPRILAEEEK